MKKNILITGVAGFIGYSLALELLKKGYKIYGLDNFDNYYSIIFKKLRVKNLKKNKNFYFKKLDITNNKDLTKYLKLKKITTTFFI